MTRYLAGLTALAALVACGDGNPFTTNGGTTPPPTPGADPVPAAVSNDLDGFSYNPTTGELMITGIYLDTSPTTVNYVRKPALDVAASATGDGYIAYAVQEDSLDQHVTAYAQRTGAVTAVLAVSGGQFGFYNGGARYTRAGAYDPLDVTPTSGLATYAGDYVGLSNVDGPGGDLIPPPPLTSPSVRPGQAGLITGDIFVNVDFGDSQLKGTVFNRVLGASGGPEILPDLVLVPTALAADGTFSGSVEYRGATGLVAGGTYGGILGGPDSEAMAGGLTAKDHFEDTRTGEEEYGIFVLGRCGTAVGTSSLCP